MIKLIELLKKLTKNKIVEINTSTGMVIFLNPHNLYNVLHICAWDSRGDHLPSLLSDDISYLDIIISQNNLTKEKALFEFHS